MKKLAEFLSSISAIIGMIVVPPLAGFVGYGLWLHFPTPYDTQTPALLAGVWAAVVVAAVIRKGFE